MFLSVLTFKFRLERESKKPWDINDDKYTVIRSKVDVKSYMTYIESEGSSKEFNKKRQKEILRLFPDLDERSFQKLCPQKQPEDATVDSMGFPEIS